MQAKSYSWAVFILSLCGTLFAGYLTTYKLFTGNCALNEPCPLFLGYPACWFGLAMFLTMLVVAFMAVGKGAASALQTRTLAVVSALGTIFASSFVVPELTLWLQSGASYALGLPSCVYGLIFYIAILVLSLWRLAAARSDSAAQ